MNQQQRPRFSWGAWIGGVLLALLVAIPLSFGIAVFATWSRNVAASVLVTVMPALIVAVIAFTLKNRNGFPQGLLTGACVAALIGGTLGYMCGMMAAI